MIYSLAFIVLKASHAAFIVGAWAIAVSVLLGVLLQSLIVARRNRARLAMLEKMAPRRRQGSGAAGEAAAEETAKGQSETSEKEDA